MCFPTRARTDTDIDTHHTPRDAEPATHRRIRQRPKRQSHKLGGAVGGDEESRLSTSHQRQARKATRDSSPPGVPARYLDGAVARAAASAATTVGFTHPLQRAARLDGLSCQLTHDTRYIPCVYSSTFSAWHFQPFCCSHTQRVYN